MSIEVSLSTTDPSAAFIEVRAEHHVKARPVNFVNGQTGFVSFKLDLPLAHSSVHVRDVEWHWEYRLGPHHPWHHFAVTRHRLYFVLDVPTGPWKQAPFNAANTQLPWTDVLDYACRWAAILGRRHAVGAGSAITKLLGRLLARRTMTSMTLVSRLMGIMTQPARPAAPCSRKTCRSAIQAICNIAIVSQRPQGARIAIRNLVPANVGRRFRSVAMEAQQRRYLEKRYLARHLHGPASRARADIKNFNIAASE